MAGTRFNAISGHNADCYIFHKSNHNTQKTFLFIEIYIYPQLVNYLLFKNAYTI